jgi:hypothetical protein
MPRDDGIINSLFLGGEKSPKVFCKEKILS